MKLTIILLLSLLANLCVAQYNLVPNPSLEVSQPNDSCLFNPATTEYVRPWSDIVGGTAFYSFDSCSYYSFFRVPNTIFGYQIPHSGKSYGALGTYVDTSLTPNAGFGSYYRNFPFVKLKETLKSNHVYVVDFYVNLIDSSYLACSNIGACFSADSLDYTQINLSSQNIFPQVENNPILNPLTSKSVWTLVHGCFSAIGNENYITLGNFISQHLCDTVKVSGNLYGNSAYFLDDVSVIELRANALADDTLICSNTGFTKTLRVYDGMQNILWSNGDTTQSTTVSQAGKYWVTASNECGTVTDTITTKVVNPNAYTFNLGNDSFFCTNFSKQLNIINPNLHNIHWSTNDTIASINTTQPGTYWANAQSECGLQSDTIVITQATLPNNIITQTDTTIYVGDSLTIQAIDGLEQYEWSTGAFTNSISVSAPHIIAAQAAISITAYTPDGCLVTDSITINFKEKPKVELPIIIPNPQIKSKAKGNVFTIINLPANSTLQLFDARGRLVFESNNYQQNCSLDNLASGVYFYKISLEDATILKGKIVVLE